MNKYYVYLHYKPKSDQPFYVGLGSGDRAFQRVSRSDWWHNIVDKHGYVVEIAYMNLLIEQAKDIEKELIKRYGRADLGCGSLVNMTDGGDGSVGYRHTDTAKEKISNTHKGKKKSDVHKQLMRSAGMGNKGRLGRPHSEETKRKISLAQKGKSRKPFTEDQKRKMSESIKQSWIKRHAV